MLKNEVESPLKSWQDTIRWGAIGASSANGKMLLPLVVMVLLKCCESTPHTDKPEGCADVRGDCSQLKEVGWCQKKASVSKTICAKTCAFCVSTCVDTRDDCERLASFGWCAKRAAAMKSVCTKSCGLCHGDPVSTTQIRSSTNHTDSTGKPLNERTAVQTCADVREDCFQLSQYGWCQSRKAAMENICARTCKFCESATIRTDPPMAQVCEDKREDCPQLQAMGWCEKRPDGMKKLCAKTCNLCATQPAEVHKAPPTVPVTLEAPRTGAPCTDVYGRTRCEYYRYLGWCEKHANMNTYCRNTCFCSVRKPEKACEMSNYGCCWDNKTTKDDVDGTSCPKCRDDPRFAVLCDRFGGDCGSSGGLAESLQKYCPKTCDLC